MNNKLIEQWFNELYLDILELKIGRLTKERIRKFFDANIDANVEIINRAIDANNQSNLNSLKIEIHYTSLHQIMDCIAKKRPSNTQIFFDPKHWMWDLLTEEDLPWKTSTYEVEKELAAELNITNRTFLFMVLSLKWLLGKEIQVALKAYRTNETENDEINPKIEEGIILIRTWIKYFMLKPKIWIGACWSVITHFTALRRTYFFQHYLLKQSKAEIGRKRNIARNAVQKSIVVGEASLANTLQYFIKKSDWVQKVLALNAWDDKAKKEIKQMKKPFKALLLVDAFFQQFNSKTNRDIFFEQTDYPMIYTLLVNPQIELSDKLNLLCELKANMCLSEKDFKLLFDWIEKQSRKDKMEIFSYFHAKKIRNRLMFFSLLALYSSDKLMKQAVKYIVVKDKISVREIYTRLSEYNTKILELTIVLNRLNELFLSEKEVFQLASNRI